MDPLTLWFLATLAGLASSVEQDRREASLKAMSLRYAWDRFFLSADRGAFSEAQWVAFDRALEAGEPPPGWVLATNDRCYPASRIAPNFEETLPEGIIGPWEVRAEVTSVQPFFLPSLGTELFRGHLGFSFHADEEPPVFLTLCFGDGAWGAGDAQTRWPGDARARALAVDGLRWGRDVNRFSLNGLVWERGSVPASVEALLREPVLIRDETGRVNVVPSFEFATPRESPFDRLSVQPFFDAEAYACGYVLRAVGRAHAHQEETPWTALYLAPSAEGHSPDVFIYNDGYEFEHALFENATRRCFGVRGGGPREFESLVDAKEAALRHSEHPAVFTPSGRVLVFDRQTNEWHDPPREGSP